MFGLEVAGLVGLIGLVLFIYALYHIIGSHASVLAKALWTVGLLIFPIVGFVVWLIFGPRAGR